MLPDDLRELNPTDKFFFIFSIGVEAALHNYQWCKRGLDKDVLPDVDIWMACEREMPKQTIPFILVSKFGFNDIKDPHIAEHEWEKINNEILENIKQR